MKKWLFTAAICCIVFSAQSQSWLIDGNAGTDTKVHFIGTKDNRSLLFRINNTFSGLLDSNWQQTFFGYKAGRDISAGNNNVAMGYFSLSQNSSGHHGTAVGSRALQANSTGLQNTALGYSSLQNNTTGGLNTATGGIALYSNTSGGANTAHGFGALSESNGSYNTASGYESLYYNQTGGYNTAVGSLSCFYNFGGSYNTALGSSALFYGNNSSYNTCIGYAAGDTYAIGWNNTILGANCDVNTSGRYNCIAIGQGVVCTANSQARIGNSATTSIGGYTNWTNISDGRYKKDIQQNVKGLDFIMKLQPVTYHLDIFGLNKKLKEGGGKEMDEFTRKATIEKEKLLYSGFIAQDVEKAAKEAGYDFSGVDKPQDKDDLYGLRYAEFVVPLVKGMQEQQQIIQELIKQNASLQQRVEQLEKNTGSKAGSIATEALTVWPNPSNGKLFVMIDATQKSKVVIKVTDAKGALIKQEQKQIIAGTNQLSIEVDGIANGIYYVTAEWADGSIKKTAQVIKQ